MLRSVSPWRSSPAQPGHDVAGVANDLRPPGSGCGGAGTTVAGCRWWSGSWAARSDLRRSWGAHPRRQGTCPGGAARACVRSGRVAGVARRSLVGRAAARVSGRIGAGAAFTDPQDTGHRRRRGHPEDSSARLRPSGRRDRRRPIRGAVRAGPRRADRWPARLGRRDVDRRAGPVGGDTLAEIGSEYLRVEAERLHQTRSPVRVQSPIRSEEIRRLVTDPLWNRTWSSCNSSTRAAGRVSRSV